MARLEDIQRGCVVRGILPDETVTIIDAQPVGSAIDVTFKDSSGKVDHQLIYRDREPDLTLEKPGQQWTYDGNSASFRLVSEAQRIKLAYLFDPLLAVHTSRIDPLPHQITAVYEKMLPRQPLRFLLADDPGAGKTIMTGLLIKELIARGDLERCLIICPGSLVTQWHEELADRFDLSFDVMERDSLEAAPSGNWFNEHNLAICRLDALSRNPSTQNKLSETDWDLIVCDEAHKMSASYWGSEIKRTKRFQLGQLLSSLTRHFLLLTATPHNGKEEEFQFFLSLLDPDRFEGTYREGAHHVDASDLMRRMVKEDLLKFDGTRLFPQRRAYPVPFELTGSEKELYDKVTDYVRNQFDRVKKLTNDGRKYTVGFALTVLQRRLASSPEAIYQSLQRRRIRLEERCKQPQIDAEILDDLEGTGELEELEDAIVDRATAAKTVAELKAEITILTELEELADRIRKLKCDRKWDELSRLLQDRTAMFDSKGHRRKLIIFTEHRATLEYLHDRISALLGKPEAVVTIHGGLPSGARSTAQAQFTHNPDVEVLIATDAAGEGINLQCAHLMVNYDLPWNPNRLEQRFGRIHRIGQTETCHCWNLIATNTREGEVYELLLKKLETAKKALQGKVFDVLGKVKFDNMSLHELMVQAICDSDNSNTRAKWEKAIDTALNEQHLHALLDEHGLAKEAMEVSSVWKIKQNMDRDDARRLQPHFISSFFIDAFKQLGGTIHPRETGRYEITHVPATLRNHRRATSTSQPIPTRYARITFEKNRINAPENPHAPQNPKGHKAEFICPGHPLLNAVIDLTLQNNRHLLKRGAILIDENDLSTNPRALVYLKHDILDGCVEKDGSRRTISQQMQFVEINSTGSISNAGYAPYLDYRPPQPHESELLQNWTIPQWAHNIENPAVTHADQTLARQHYHQVKNERQQLIDKTKDAVNARLTSEIIYWDRRANELQEDEQAGKPNPKISSQKARQRADELEKRLEKRLTLLEQQRQVVPQPPQVLGGAMIIPLGLLYHLQGSTSDPDTFARDTKRIEAIAMKAVMETEISLGFHPKDVSAQRCGYDIESSPGPNQPLRFIEVKGRIHGADEITVTKNEVLTALNKPHQFILAIVLIDGEASHVRYVRNPFTNPPDFAQISSTYSLKKLLQHSQDPS